MHVPATQLSVGMIIRHQGDLYRILDLTHVTPGNKRGMVQSKLRNLRTGLQTENRFRSADQVERVTLEQQEMEFLYEQDGLYHLMDTQTYEQLSLAGEVLGDAVNYITPNFRLQVDFCDDRPVGVSLPKTVDLRVADTPPGMKTATVTGEMKPATLETGLVVKVPSFISPGEVVRVDTTTGAYVARVR